MDNIISQMKEIKYDCETDHIVIGFSWTMNYHSKTKFRTSRDEAKQQFSTILTVGSSPNDNANI